MELRTLDFLAYQISQYLPTDKRLTVSYVIDIGDDSGLFAYNNDGFVRYDERQIIVYSNGPIKTINWSDPDCYRLAAKILIGSWDQVIDH